MLGKEKSVGFIIFFAMALCLITLFLSAFFNFYWQDIDWEKLEFFTLCNLLDGKN